MENLSIIILFLFVLFTLLGTGQPSPGEHRGKLAQRANPNQPFGRERPQSPAVHSRLTRLCYRDRCAHPVEQDSGPPLDADDRRLIIQPRRAHGALQKPGSEKQTHPH